VARRPCVAARGTEHHQSALGHRSLTLGHPGGQGQPRINHCGLARIGWMFTLTATAYNLVRLAKLVGAVK
jgi:hypothetical protein